MRLVLYFIKLLKEVSNKPRQQEAKQMLALAESMIAAAVECGHLNLMEQEVVLLLKAVTNVSGIYFYCKF